MFKRHIFLALSFISLLVIWQGIHVSSGAFGRGDLYNEFTNVQKKVRANLNASEELPTGEKVSFSRSGDIDSIQSELQAGQGLPVKIDSEQQWAFEQIQAWQVPKTDRSDSQVLVAVLDTGIDRYHEDLSGKVIDQINFTECPEVDDIYGHGTHVAGIIAARDDNNIGIIGLAPECSLMNVKVADDNGRCKLSALADGIIWAVDNGVNVINISIEIQEPTSRLEEAVNYAWDNGAVVVAAAGNEGNDTPVYPAAYDNCIAVTALRENDTLAPLANHGKWVSVAAPGFEIYSTLPGDDYGYKHGTSFAAAYVSGLAAILFPVVTDANNDGKLNDEVRRAIENGCRDIQVEGTGQGCIDVNGSLTEALSVHANNTETSPASFSTFSSPSEIFYSR